MQTINQITEYVLGLDEHAVNLAVAEKIMGWESWDNDGKFGPDAIHYWVFRGSRYHGHDANILGKDWQPTLIRDQSREVMNAVIEYVSVEELSKAFGYVGCPPPTAHWTITPDQECRASLIAYMIYELYCGNNT